MKSHYTLSPITRQLLLFNSALLLTATTGFAQTAERYTGIFYDNAARFLGLNEEEIAKHHN